jgi:hypothetical protein
MLWAIARACVQSMTIDEADTYLFWVARPDPSHWEAASNNHVLNSLLMRLFTSVLGTCHLSVRAPALLGAVIYIAAALSLCTLVSPVLRVQWPLFVGMVFNPFIFDHLVAARGYALATAFLVAAIAIVAWARERDWPIEKACAACSIVLALSFAANFSFAIVDAFTISAIGVWACTRRQSFGARVRVLGACVLPGLLVTLFVSAPSVLHFPRGELRYGSHSVAEWFGEVARDSMYQLNPHIVNPMLMEILMRVQPVLLPLLLGLAAWEWVRERDRWLLRILLVIIAASIATHLAAFKLLHVLLPKERTAIWIVPLITLAIGTVASGRRALTIALYALSFYFLLCLRLNYFREWFWDADVRQVYTVLARYNHEYGETRVRSNWMYGAALNYYRHASGAETLEEIASAVQLVPDRPIYVLNYLSDEEWLKQQGLRVVYHGPTTDVVIAVRPEVEVQWRSLRCAAP